MQNGKIFYIITIKSKILKIIYLFLYVDKIYHMQLVLSKCNYSVVNFVWKKFKFVLGCLSLVVKTNMFITLAD